MAQIAGDIGLEGRRWDADEAFERFSLTPEKLEMLGGKLYWTDTVTLAWFVAASGVPRSRPDSARRTIR